MLDELARVWLPGTQIMLAKFEWTSGKWQCNIERKADGVELKISAQDEDPNEAVQQAIKKFERATTRGIPELTNALTYQPDTKSAPLNDEIPF